MFDFSIFRQEFESGVKNEALTWEVLGFYDGRGIVYPFGTDTKVISTVFEALCFPIIDKIARKYDYKIETSEQTVYPDFTLTKPGEKHIAIDIKTTYRNGNKKFKYTLGSYTSFLRSGTKNILYPYESYSDHWVIGFLYTRRKLDPSLVSEPFYIMSDIDGMISPYYNVEYFVQEKYKIVGLRPASGNTANIGSFPTNNINDLREGLGPFSIQGKQLCDDYWRNYDPKKYNSIESYLEFRKRIDDLE